MHATEALATLRAELALEARLAQRHRTCARVMLEARAYAVRIAADRIAARTMDPAREQWGPGQGKGLRAGTSLAIPSLRTGAGCTRTRPN